MINKALRATTFYCCRAEGVKKEEEMEQIRRANKGVGREVNKMQMCQMQLALPNAVCVGGNIKVNVEIFHPLAH